MITTDENWQTHLLIEELTGFLLDGVEILDLSGRETHDERDALRCGRVLVEVVTRRLSPLVDPFVYRLTEVHGLQRGDETISKKLRVTHIQRPADVTRGGKCDSKHKEESAETFPAA